MAPQPTAASPTLATSPRVPVVALIGNPNTGKSSLFNALSGFHSQTGNYPGVTVEKKLGRITTPAGTSITLVDLPGTYSLTPRSPDEMVAVNVLLGRQADVGMPNAVVCILDTSNLERNLYLLSQILDMGLPTLVVLNMTDVAASKGLSFDATALAERLGVPVVCTQAHRREGIDAVREAIVRLSTTHARPRGEQSVFPQAFTDECERMRQALAGWGRPDTPLYLCERLLIDVGGYIEGHMVDASHRAALERHLAEARARLATANCKVPALEAKSRYAWGRKILTGIYHRPAERPVTFSDKVDRWLTHRWVGLIVFVALMFLIFQAISSFAAVLMEWCEAGQSAIGGLVSAVIPPGPLHSLLVDGVIGGVGSVLIFLPQIVILFLFIAILEDCGYMPRASFLMDRLMTRVGLSGKSFVPLMSSFACAIPGVMATRVIENRRDRLVTILVAPLMSCSARQPVYVLMIASFIPAISYLGGWVSLQGLVLLAASSLGAVVAIPVAWLLKGTLLRGETPPFVMELPSYKWPSPRVVVHRALEQGKAFVMRAGTLIFATTILVWGASYFPADHSEFHQVERDISRLEEPTAAAREKRSKLDERRAELVPLDGQAQLEIEDLDFEKAGLDGDLKEWDGLRERKDQLAEQLLAASFLGRFGRLIEPVVAPLGWDWKIGVGVIASFPAREVVVATLGTIYSLGSDVDERHVGLQGTLRSATHPDGRPVYNVAVALSIMVFFALCAQCASTLMVIRRETNSWGWPAFTFAYMTGLAYLAALATYQITIRL